MKQIILLTILLTGCANSMVWGPPITDEERASMEKEAAETEIRYQQEKARAIMAKYSPFCSELGFKNETPAFVDCVLKLYQQDKSIAAERRNAAVRGGGITNCNRIGNSINCVTY
jgi:hypothetical protein